MIKPLIIIGVPFLIYNFCFNLISMASRSVVAYGYEINEMGYFTFAVSLTTAIMLVFNSATWIIYPSLINKLSDKLLNVQDQQSLLLSITKKNNISFIYFNHNNYGSFTFSILFFSRIFIVKKSNYNPFNKSVGD